MHLYITQEFNNHRLGSDLDYNCNNQHCCMLVGQMALLCGTIPHEKLLCNHDNFSKLLSSFVDSSVVELHASMHIPSTVETNSTWKSLRITYGAKSLLPTAFGKLHA